MNLTDKTMKKVSDPLNFPPVLIFIFLVVNMLYAEFTEEHAWRLAQAVWKQPPESMDVTFYATARDFRKSEKEIRQTFEDISSRQEGDKEGLSARQLEDRQRRIEKGVELNVASWLKGQKVGQTTKTRVRYDTNRMRVDQVTGTNTLTIRGGPEKGRVIPGRPVDADTPFNQSIIEIDDPDGGARRYNIARGVDRTGQMSSHVQQMDIQQRGALNISSPARRMELPGTVKIALRSEMGDLHEDGVWEPNEAKINQLVAGQNLAMAISIKPDEDFPDSRVQIEINRLLFINETEHPLGTYFLICDDEDYTRVHLYKFFRPGDDHHPIEHETRSDFDEHGMPHNVSVKRYGHEGNIVQHSEIRIESIRINIDLPDDAFGDN